MDQPEVPTPHFPTYLEHSGMPSRDSSANAQPTDEEARDGGIDGKADSDDKEQTERGKKLLSLLFDRDDLAAFNHFVPHVEEAQVGVRRQVEIKAQELRELGYESDAELLMRELERLEENAPTTPTQRASCEEETTC